MYKLEKRFTFPMGHRLSKHAGRCFSMHGHNFTVLVGLKAEKLNSDDMIMDFSDVKKVVLDFLDKFDHCLVLNETDKDLADNIAKMGTRVMTLQTDPTAERLAELFYKNIHMYFATDKNYNHIKVDYITVYENENSKATYEE